MKTFLTTFKTIAIVIAMLGFGNRAMAQDIKIDDGSTAILNTAGTWNNVITSTTESSASTAILQIGATSAVNIDATATSTMSGYYGTINFFNGSSLALPGNNTIAAKAFNISAVGGTTTATTTLTITSGGPLTFSGKSGANTIDMGHEYGQLGFTGTTGNLTITNGNIYFGDYTEATNPSYIYFPISTTTQTYSIILDEGGSKIYTNESSGTVDVSKNFKFNMNDAVGETVSEVSSFTVAKTKGATLVTGTPILSYNSDGLWANPTVTSTLADGYYNVKLNATFDAIFQIDEVAVPKRYKGWSGLMTVASDATSASAKLLKTTSNMISDRTFTNNYTIDLQNFSITDATNSSIITDTKTLTIGSTGTGVFSGNIKFGGTTSTLKVTKAGLLNSLKINIGSTASGIIEFNNVIDAISINQAAFNNKLGTVKVASGSVITITTIQD